MKIMMLNGRVRRRLALWALVNFTAMIALIRLKGLLFACSADPFELMKAWWWNWLLPAPMALLMLPFLLGVYRMRKRARETDRTACIDCLYDLGHQGVDDGRCPECGAQYTLEDVRKTWDSFLY